MRFLFILLLVMLSSSLAFAEKKAPTTRPVAKKITKKKASETRRAKRMQKLKKILNVKNKINSLKPHGNGGNPLFHQPAATNSPKINSFKPHGYGGNPQKNKAAECVQAPGSRRFTESKSRSRL